MNSPFCPLQYRLCCYHARLSQQPFFEPLRALPMTARVQMSPSQFVLDRMIEALDAAERMLEEDRQTKEALESLSTEQRELCLHLAAYPTSAMLFDFGKAAAVWVVRDRGLCPGANTPNYAAWLEAKRYRKARLVEAWQSVRKSLLQLGLDNLS